MRTAPFVRLQLKSLISQNAAKSNCIRMCDCCKFIVCLRLESRNRIIEGVRSELGETFKRKADEVVFKVGSTLLFRLHSKATEC